MADLLSDRSSLVLAKSLDGYAERHKAISSNIANAETPGYKRLAVSFENELRQVLEDDNAQRVERAIPQIQTEMTRDYSTPSRTDGNNVVIDQEVTGLMKNSMSYQATASLLNQKLAALRIAIMEGRR